MGGEGISHEWPQQGSTERAPRGARGKCCSWGRSKKEKQSKVNVETRGERGDADRTGGGEVRAHRRA